MVRIGSRVKRPPCFAKFEPISGHLIASNGGRVMFCDPEDRDDETVYNGLRREKGVESLRIIINQSARSFVLHLCERNERKKSYYPKLRDIVLRGIRVLIIKIYIYIYKPTILLLFLGISPNAKQYPP